MSDQSQQEEGNATGLFNGLPQHETFTQMHQIYNVTTR